MTQFKLVTMFLLTAALMLLAGCGGEPSQNPSPWPPVVDDQWIAIQGLTELVYPQSENPAKAWSEPKSSNKTKGTLEDLEKEIKSGLDAGKITQQEADKKLQQIKSGDPKEDGTVKKEPEEPSPDWMRGYPYALKVPSGYSQSTRQYPMVIYLHGGQSTSLGKNNSFMNQFYMPSQDPYIIVGPNKIEWDWDAKKISDVFQDVKANLRVDDDRIYLTGVSMGGRGTYIVAAALPNLFAALMPLSSHHGPYSYVNLAPKVTHLPIWTSHGDQDIISSYDVAAEMVDELEKLGADVIFQTVSGGGHYGWDTIYRNPNTFDWLLSQKNQ